MQAAIAPLLNRDGTPAGDGVSSTVPAAAAAPTAAPSAATVSAPAAINTDWLSNLREILELSGLPMASQFVSSVLKVVSAAAFARLGRQWAITVANLIAMFTSLSSASTMFLSDVGRLVKEAHVRLDARKAELQILEAELERARYPGAELAESRGSVVRSVEEIEGAIATKRAEITAEQSMIGGYVRQGFLVSLGIAAVLSTGAWFAGDAFKVMGNSSDVVDDVNAYLRSVTMSLGWVPFAGMVVQRRFFGGMRHSIDAAALPVVSSGLAAAGAIGAVAAGGGVSAVGLTFSAANWLAFFYGLARLCKAEFSLFSGSWTWDAEKFSELAKAGAPILLGIGLECLTVVVLAGLMDHRGSEAATAYSIINLLLLLAVVPSWTGGVFTGIKQGGVIARIKEEHDAGTLTEVRYQAYMNKLSALLLASRSLTAGLVFGAEILYFTIPRPLTYAVAGEVSPEVQEQVDSRLWLIGLFNLVDALRALTISGPTSAFRRNLQSTVFNSTGLLLGLSLAIYGITAGYDLGVVMLLFYAGVTAASVSLNVDLHSAMSRLGEDGEPSSAWYLCFERCGNRRSRRAALADAIDGDSAESGATLG